MTIRDLIKDWVLADATVSGWLGTRVYPKRLPQKVTYPAAVITKVDIVRPAHLRGSATLAKARIQFDVYCNANGAALLGAAGSEDVVDQIGAAIRVRMESGVHVILTDTTTTPDTDVDVWITSDLDTEGDEPDLHGGTSRNSADYLVQYQTHSGSY